MKSSSLLLCLLAVGVSWAVAITPVRATSWRPVALSMWLGVLVCVVASHNQPHVTCIHLCTLCTVDRELIAVHGLLASKEAMSHAAKWIEADYPGIHVQ